MLYLDNHGAIGLEVALNTQTVIPTRITNLNDKNLPDAYWLTPSGKNVGIELKQPGEILGNIADIEEQLAREYTQVDELSLYIAGVVVPNPHGHGCYVLKWAHNARSGYLMGVKGGGPYLQDYEGYRSWLRSLRMWGIETYESPNKLALASAIIAAYRHDQKAEEEHKTFRRPLRTKKPMGTWDPRGLTLMGLVDPKTGRTFLGPEVVTSLLAVYPTVYDVLGAPAADLAKVPLLREENDTRRAMNLGPAKAEALKRAIS